MMGLPEKNPMGCLRTPDDCFADLPGFDYSPNYLTVDDTEGGELRVHYLDEGPADAAPVLLMHGEPSWSFLYRKMIPSLVQAGFRCLAPDLIGFGKSDKPDDPGFYTYARHVDWLEQWRDAVVPQNAGLFCQDWGGLIGLRLIAQDGGLGLGGGRLAAGLLLGGLLLAALLGGRLAGRGVPLGGGRRRGRTL